MKNIQKSIGITDILRDVSFIIEEKEKAALVGVNGAGKTSIFRLITGVWQADEGELIRASGTRLGYLPQIAEADAQEEMDAPSPTQTLYDVLDAVFAPLKKVENEMRTLEQNMASQNGEALQQTMARYDKLTQRFTEEGGFESSSRVRGVLRGLGFADERWMQPFGQLSGGEKTRAMLGRLLLERADLLLLDEPTNHLDIESVAWLEEYLRNFAGAVLLISHDRYFMDKVVTKTIEIENKTSFVYNGNYTTFAKQKAANREIAEKQYREQQKVIKHHEKAIQTIRSFSTEAAIIRAKSREKLLDKMERVEKPTALPNTMRLRLVPSIKSGHDVLSIEDLTFTFDDADVPLFENISFELKKGDKAAIIGPNGIGKTTLLKILMGEAQATGGRFREGVNVKSGYYDQAQQRLDENKTLFEELSDTYPKLTNTEIRGVLAAFMFIGDDVFKPISTLSGGERGRVALAKITLAGANFLVLDEPTNHLDLFSKELLEEAIRKFEGTVLYISHDRYFINHTATQILELSPDGLTKYYGNYDKYVEKKQALTLDAQNEAPVLEKVEVTQKMDYISRKEQQAAERKLKAQITRIEAEISDTEEAIANCDAKLLDDKISRDAQAAAEVFHEKTELEQKLVVLLEEWEEAHV
ncbi:MAG: ABC-F family ATP-binding cassette domain-containing protein [Defluviitaleaceae bacterium]|nr:ABC-F family ATP-binding cassette domain-containing protein [Defluviitaleaceae bacterium]MCL2275366.1 ABC-F family ATP-binding cassette domain-containing protein [Defluviitaleaceae bacterium]